MSNTTSSVLPRVYMLGFRAGQALCRFSSTYYDFGSSSSSSSTGSDGGSTGFLTNATKIWSTVQEEAPHVWSMMTRFPLWYRTWWMDLLKNDPVHVFVETTLLLSVVYMFVTRTKDWRESRKAQLTDQEEEDLIKEWKETIRAPLTPSVKELPCSTADVPDFVVHKVEGTSLHVSMDEDDVRYQVKNFGTFDFLGMAAEFTGNRVENKENAISTSDATTNVSTNTTTTSTNSAKKNKKKKKKKTKSDGNEDGQGANDNAATDTTIMNNNNPMKQAAVEALDRYGVGACGPRGFYGTIDPHLQLEEEFTEFMGSEGAILYSDGASTCSSTVAAFCKRGDLLVVDEGVYEPLIAGIKLSRAYVKWFKHNDMRDLRRVLESVKGNDKKLGRAPSAQRRFIICEGLYKNTGQIAPLDQIVTMKHEFHYRLILDESFSFGTLGATGRGALELFQKRLMYDAEVVTVSLENALGSIGGLTVGNEEVVDHQRLSGSGYCFSASSPPFTASAAIQALRKLKTNSKELLTKLNENKQYLYDKLQAFSHSQEDLILISSDIRSPIVFLVLAECPETEDIDATVFLSEVVRGCIRRGVGTVSSGQYNSRAGVQLLRAEPPPSIRMTVSAAHTKEDIDFAVQALSESLGDVMNRYVEGKI